VGRLHVCWAAGAGVGKMVLDTICFGTESRDHQTYTPGIDDPFGFCFTLFWFLRAPQPSISLLSCHRIDAKGLRCRLKDIWTGRTLKRRNDKGGRGRRRRAREYYHLVLQSRFGELEFVTLVVHIHYSKEPALSSSHLHNPSRVSQWASLSNKW
jgi:hypothetical protein